MNCVAAGRVPISWQVVPCAVSGPVAYRYKEGSSQYWTAIQVRNHRLPITSLEVQLGGAWQPVSRSDYNYFNDWTWYSVNLPPVRRMFGENSNTTIAMLLDGSSNTVAMCETLHTVANGSCPAFGYRGWWHNPALPKFNTNTPAVRRFLFDVAKHWINFGADGWRLDVPGDIDDDTFWQEFRYRVRRVNSQAYIVGEIWHEAQRWLQGDQFDAVMNYRVAREACLFFKAHREKISASVFDRRLHRIRDDYRPGADQVLMNLLDSHDTDRLGSMIVNADTRYDHAVSAKDNPAYDVRKPTARELAIQRLMVIFQFMYPGAPMIYYGDEAGMWGGDDPDERKPMVWPGMVFSNEASHPFGAPRPSDPVFFDSSLFEHYRGLIGHAGE